MNSKPELVAKIEETIKVTTEKNSESEMGDECEVTLPPMPEKNSWPELVGKKGEVAKAIIESENPDLYVVVVKPGDVWTFDFRFNRVRIVVDENGLVIRTPIIG